MTLTNIVEGIKKNNFKFEKVKSGIDNLSGLLDKGVVIVQPMNNDDLIELQAFLEGMRKNTSSRMTTVSPEYVQELVTDLRNML